MKHSILTGLEWTALTVLYWTTDPMQITDRPWLHEALSGLLAKGYTEPVEHGGIVYWELTPKGTALVDHVISTPEPKSLWTVNRRE